MRVVIQRVTRAAVRVAGETVGAIEQPGYLVLVGITHGDGAAQIAKLADKDREPAPAGGGEVPAR